MPSFFSQADERLAGIIENWKETAVSEVDDIGGWRGVIDDPPESQSDEVADRVVRGLGWNAPCDFYTDTAYLIGELTAHFPKLDPQPLYDICRAVSNWHADHNASRIPNQLVLLSTLELAMVVLASVMTDILSRRIPNKPEAVTDGASVDCLVTLQQAAAMVNRSKRSLERAVPNMPMPRVQGAGGKPSEWEWSELRPWLETEYGRPLPERFPADRFRPV